MVTATETSTVEIGILGPLSARRDGQELDLGGPKQRAVLALLAVEDGRTVGRDVLIEGIWGDAASDSNRASLQTYVYNLRILLGGLIVREGTNYRLDLPADRVDANRFVAVLERARNNLATDPAGTAAALRNALASWRGRPLSDLDEIPGLETRIRQLEELRLQAVELRIDADLATGHHEALIAEVEALASEHPFRERLRAQHMLALYRSGRQAEALRSYRDTADFLADELGLSPSVELRDLELAILQQSDDLLVGAGRATTQRTTVMVTDIEGSTRSWDRNPQAMAEALAQHDRILQEAVESESGRIFKHTGDGVLAAFPDLVSAVEAAESAQRAFAEADWGEISELRVRIGIDSGEVEARGGDFFGPAVNRAARLCAAGHGGQVLVSATAQTELAGTAPVGVQVRHLGEFQLRGFSTPERVAQLVFVGAPADFPPLRLDTDASLDERTPVTIPGYEVRERIGEGALGVVWRAYQPSVGREVAIKFIRPELSDHPAFVRRFEAEARTIARLAHPHIVPLIDFWREAEGAYLVLQLLPGGSLSDALASSIPVGAARRILAQVGAALDHAHSQGVVHGDLKPSNVLLDGSGNAYLSDFGIATRLLDPALVASVSSAPEYRAPEELTTGPTTSADLYALGVLARDLLGSEPDTAPVLARAMAVSPADRYPSAASFLTDLERALGDKEEEGVPTAPARNPYKGLRAFDEADRADFFGRTDLVAALASAVAEHSFVTVVGPSGSGKSSVVQAGLLPALAGGAVPGAEEWFRVVMTPGSHPTAALAEAIGTVAIRPVDPSDLVSGGLDGVVERYLTGSGGQLLIVVDQFEELYTLVDDPDRRKEFLELLLTGTDDATDRVRVVATLRADFYDRPLEDPKLGRVVRDGLVTVLPPTGDELVEMISAPAEAVGLRWEPGLPHRMARDVADQPGALPLLQYALTELVERRSGGLLTGADYQRVGGVAGALAARAEALYSDFNPARQEATRQTMLRLVAVDEENDDTRRRVRRSELQSLGIPRHDIDAVLDTLTAERLLLADRDPVTRGPTIEVAHEALLRSWPRLRTWIDDQRESLVLGRRFRTAMADWDTAGRHSDYLLTGSRLAPFLGWAESSALTPDERAFYDASVTRDDQERTARRKRRRILTGILTGATVVATSLGVFASIQASRASDSAEEAEAGLERALAAELEAERQAEVALGAAAEAEIQALLARSRELTAAAIPPLTTDPSLAKLLALASTDLMPPSLDTLSVLRRALATDRIVARHPWPEGYEDIWSMALSPDGTRVATVGTLDGATDRLEVIDVATWSTLWSLDLENWGSQVHFSPDSSSVIVGLTASDIEMASQTGIHVWSAADGSLQSHWPVGECGADVTGVATNVAMARVWPAFEGGCDYDEADIDSPFELVNLLDGTRQTLFTSGFDGVLSGDGKRAAVIGREGISFPVRVVDTSTGDQHFERDMAPHALDPEFFWALDHHGDRLLTSSRPMIVWDVATGEMLSQNPHGAMSALFSGDPNEPSVFSSGLDGITRQWEPDTGREIDAFPAVGGWEITMADDSSVMVANDASTRTFLVVAPSRRGEVWNIATCGGFVPAQSLNVAGGHAVMTVMCSFTDVNEALTYVIDIATRSITRVVPGHSAQALLLSPDGGTFVRQDAESPDGTPDLDWVGPARIRSATTGSVEVDLAGPCHWWEVEGLQCAEEEPGGFPLWAMDYAWSSDGRFVAAANLFSGTAVLWDATDGSLVANVNTCETAAFGVLFSPDSDELLASCEGGGISAISTQTGEVTRSTELGVREPYLVGYNATGDTVVAISRSGPTAVLWLDAATLEVVGSVEEAHNGFIKVRAISPDRSLVATGSSDGVVKVWDMATRLPVHEIDFGITEIQGVAFLDDDHLAIAPFEGGMYVSTLDVAELINIAQDSLTRGFTPAECERFAFGDDCPRLPDQGPTSRLPWLRWSTRWETPTSTPG